VLTVARIAGIMAAKKTSDLIPLCHPLPLSKVDINLSINTDLPGIDIKVTVRTFGKTGVEMEALTGVTITALTIYDMIKAVDKTMSINNIILTFKDGGKSGQFGVKP
nr:cyclic pyranopterin monophosphate synthase MoaC [Paracoccaceae bacterium]